MITDIPMIDYSNFQKVSDIVFYAGCQGFPLQPHFEVCRQQGKNLSAGEDAPSFLSAKKISHPSRCLYFITEILFRTYFPVLASRGEQQRQC